MDELIRYIVVSACLGALTGLIRQWSEQTGNEAGEFAGVRTQTFWAVLGCLGAFAAEAHTPHAFALVLLLVAAHLIARTVKEDERRAPGSTSFASALLTVFTGALVFWDETKSAILVAATTMVMLGIKQPIHAWTREINARDIRATLQFVAISGVILPLVPNRDLGPYGAFNPFSTWLMVVLISGLGFAGYVAIRLIGARAGILRTGLLGGLASSTASTLAFSRRSREEPKMSEHSALAVAAACTVMLPRVLIATGVVNREFALTLVVPFALMAVPGIVYAGWVVVAPPAGATCGRYTGARQSPESLDRHQVCGALLRHRFRGKGDSRAGVDARFAAAEFRLRSDRYGRNLAFRGRRLRQRGGGPGAGDARGRRGGDQQYVAQGGMAVALGSAGLRWRVGIVLGATAVVGAVWLLAGPELFFLGRRAD